MRSSARERPWKQTVREVAGAHAHTRAYVQSLPPTRYEVHKSRKRAGLFFMRKKGEPHFEARKQARGDTRRAVPWCHHH